MAESGEAGDGRMAEPLEIVAAIEAHARSGPKPLAGRRIIVTSGPTHEPIDPVRYIANRSSGRQGHAIAAALARLGADVTLVSGPVAIPDPAGVTSTSRAPRDARRRRGSAARRCAVFVAAVADWRADAEAGEKIKKQTGEAAPALELVENPDILADHRPSREAAALVVGFAAETENVVEHARAKLDRRAPTSSSPTTSRPKAASWAATATASHIVTAIRSRNGPRWTRTRWPAVSPC